MYVYLLCAYLTIWWYIPWTWQKIPWTEEPGRLQSMGLQRVRHTWATDTHIHHSYNVSFCCSKIHVSFYWLIILFTIGCILLPWEIFDWMPDILNLLIKISESKTWLQQRGIHVGFVKTTAWETKFQKALGVCSRLCYSYLLSHVQLFATPGTVAHWAPLSMGILHTRILEWVACPPAGDLRNPWIKPKSPALKEHPLAFEPPGKLNNALVLSDSLRPHGLQPVKLPCHGDSSGKNTGVDCHALLRGSIQPRSPAL